MIDIENTLSKLQISNKAEIIEGQKTFNIVNPVSLVSGADSAIYLDN
jgi:hypothetical protein